jgi:catechol 2,3-dioxygenase-like lactoylglutathione lyase family enzyme
MIDHVTIAVADFTRANAFYQGALKPLGLGAVMEAEGDDEYAGFGAEGKAFCWIAAGDKPRGGTHVAFAARTRAEVDSFHRAAIAAGGRDNGAPGLRPQYHPNYYGAFIFDPDGNNIEAVCHSPG